MNLNDSTFFFSLHKTHCEILQNDVTVSGPTRSGSFSHAKENARVKQLLPLASSSPSMVPSPCQSFTCSCPGATRTALQTSSFGQTSFCPLPFCAPCEAVTSTARRVIGTNWYRPIDPNELYSYRFVGRRRRRSQMLHLASLSLVGAAVRPHCWNFCWILSAAASVLLSVLQSVLTGNCRLHCMP